MPSKSKAESVLIARLQKFFPKTKIKKVQDATVDVNLKPVQHDIDTSKPRDPTNCMYAQCLKRSLGVHKAAVFTSKAFLIDDHGVVTRFTVPASVSKEAFNVDRGGKIPKPEALVGYLKAPSKNQRLGAKHKPRGPHTSKNTKPRRALHFAAEVRPRLW